MSFAEPVMIPPCRFAVIGGDGRMMYTSERLAAAGHEVRLLGCGTDGGAGIADGRHADTTDGGRIRRVESLREAMLWADVILLPLPATRDGETVACPREPGCTVRLEELTRWMLRRPTLRLLGGRLPERFVAQCRARLGEPRTEPSTEPRTEPSTEPNGDRLGEKESGNTEPGTRAPVRVTDYYLDEGLLLRNAYITAEAAMMTAMQLSDGTLRGMRAAVIGYGRIGRMLNRLLLAVGAEVTVAARREESLLWAECEGARTLLLGGETRGGGADERKDDTLGGDADKRKGETRGGGGVYALSRGYEVIFNTVPVPLLRREVLLRMAAGTVIVDLASPPYGALDEDAREAALYGVRYTRASALPGRYAPREAGYAVADCVLRLLGREAGGREGSV